MKHLQYFTERMLDKQGGYEDNDNLNTWNNTPPYPVSNNRKRRKKLKGEIVKFHDESDDGEIVIPYMTGSKKGEFIKAKLKN